MPRCSVPLRKTRRARRRLGYVLDAYPRLSETFVAHEIEAMLARGEEVTVFRLHPGQPQIVHAFVQAIDVEVVDLPRTPRSVLRSVPRTLRTNPLALVRSIVPAVRSARTEGSDEMRRLAQGIALAHETKVREIDHLHAHFASSPAAVARWCHAMGGPSFSVTAHAQDLYADAPGLDRRLESRLLSASFVATVSKANQQHLQTVLRGSPPVHLVPNSVDVERLQPVREPVPASAAPPRICCVARLVEKKGIRDLIAACALLKDAGDLLELDIVGEGPERARLERAAADAGLRARFHGALAYEDVLPLYRSATVFCLPCVVARNGDRDGLPTSILEAMALGLPVVSTPVNGVPDVITSGETGLLVPPRDVGALSAALRTALNDPALRARLATRARELVCRDFSIAASAEKLASYFPTRP